MDLACFAWLTAFTSFVAKRAWSSSRFVSGSRFARTDGVDESQADGDGERREEHGKGERAEPQSSQPPQVADSGHSERESAEKTSGTTTMKMSRRKTCPSRLGDVLRDPLQPVVRGAVGIGRAELTRQQSGDRTESQADQDLPVEGEPRSFLCRPGIHARAVFRRLLGSGPTSAVRSSAGLRCHGPVRGGAANLPARGTPATTPARLFLRRFAGR